MDELAVHWWWRAGWGVGKRFYTWHVNGFGGELWRVVEAYQRELVGVRGLDLVPREWLHLTMQGVGFVPEVSEGRVRELLRVARRMLGEVEPIEVRFERVTLHAEAVTLHAEPADGLRRMRGVVREAVGEVFGEVPERAGGFVPHVSVAYVAEAQAAGPVREVVERVRVEPAVVSVDSVELIELHRDNRMYEWQTVERVPLRVTGRVGS